MTGTCWRFDLIAQSPHSLLLVLGGAAALEHFESNMKGRLHVSRIVEFQVGHQKQMAHAKLLSPARSFDYACERLTIKDYRQTVRTNYSGDLPGRFRWLHTQGKKGDDKANEELDPQRVDGSCRPARANCVYLWLEARPLRRREVGAPSPVIPTSTGAAARKAAELRFMKHEFTINHVWNDRMELEVENTPRGLRITGKALHAFIYSKVQATQLVCGAAYREAGAMPKTPVPACPSGGSRTGSGEPKDDPDDFFEELRGKRPPR